MTEARPGSTGGVAVGDGPPTDGFAPTPPAGLSEEEALARRARGLGNDVDLRSSRTYLQILRHNAFSFVNTLLFAIVVALLLMGLTGDALVTASLVLMNVLVGVFQEGRAKRKLDQIALVNRPTATVVREGRERTVDPREIVVGDLVLARPGDQIVVDGRVVGEGRLAMDESLLTGESEVVPKRAGEPVYSGSFCTAGGGVYQAERVGAASLANRITAGARAFRWVQTPLQRDIGLVIRVMVLLLLVVSGPVLVDLAVRGAALLTESLSGRVPGALAGAYGGYPLEGTVQAAAVIVALVPQGLVFMITVTYATGAVRLAGKGALMQQANAVESLSHVDVLCLDKTGTLTSNRIALQEARPLGGAADELARLLGDFVASTPSQARNKTAEAIAAAFPGVARRVVATVPFSSARKWSALAADDAAMRGTYVLGAPEMLEPALPRDVVAGLAAVRDEWTARGLRVLLFATSADPGALGDGDEEADLPAALVPLGVLSFADELRPEAAATLARFAEVGVGLKVISGDHPETVAALAARAGLPRDADPVSGLDLAGMDEARLAEAAEAGVVFGRVTPEQKERLVRALRGRGHYVAMVGDGVNDVLSLKEAQLGVAMLSGSQATRAVADVVLLNDSFGALPPAFREGQRIVGGMRDVIALFLTRSLYVTLVILGATVVGADFPVTPKHNAVLALLTVGIPTLALAAWARPARPRGGLLRSVVPFVLPAALTITVGALAVYLFELRTTGEVAIARSALTTFTVLCGLLLIPFAEPPTRGWVGGDDLSPDWRPSAMAAALLGGFVAIVAIPALRDSFELTVLSAGDYLGIVAVVAVWAVSLRFAWRARLLERYLGFEGG